MEYDGLECDLLECDFGELVNFVMSRMVFLNAAGTNVLLVSY